MEKELKKGGATSTASGIYVIEVDLSISTSWILDTACGSHICSTVQGLRNRRTLTEGEVDLKVENRARLAALKIGDFSLD